MLSYIQVYKNLTLQLVLSLTLTLVLTFLKLPIIFLHGLHTYIHPDHINPNASQNGIRAAIRRPGASDSTAGLEGYQNLSSRQNPEVKKRNKSKEKFEFDENNAQIFRLKLDENHLCTRLYFKGYYDAFNFTVLAISSLLLHKYLDVSVDSGFFVNGSIVPVVLCVLGVCKVFISLARSSFERSASRRLDKQLSVLVGVLGFVLGVLICFGVDADVFDFEFGEIDGVGRFFVAVLMGCLAGFLFMPAGKSVRSFWIGTDQLGWNLSIISCGWIARALLYVNHLLVIFTSLLWINPLAKILVNKNIGDGKGAHMNNRIGGAEELVGNVGMSRSDFMKFRIWCLLVSGLSQIVVLRPNLQMYLNEAVLSWYQRLHANKVPDLDYSRAKVFLHNHYLCLVVLQFFALPALLGAVLLVVSKDGKLLTEGKEQSNEREGQLILLPCNYQGTEQNPTLALGTVATSSRKWETTPDTDCKVTMIKVNASKVWYDVL
ncbi:hypothetical protein L1049_020924 [Liquidambar formosana]|uniref:Transmembrane protein 161B n=1 Tax=Liquidambar formosana TaxID=63359 RepID=A0AAP0X7U7_LIQFO